MEWNIGCLKRNKRTANGNNPNLKRTTHYLKRNNHQSRRFFHSNCAKSIRPSAKNLTPSPRSNIRCNSFESSSGTAISPRILTTRCHGKLCFSLIVCKIRTTCLAARGLPAKRATCPYVTTRPSGISCSIRTTSAVNGCKSQHPYHLSL